MIEMGFMIRKLIAKAVEKAAKVDPSDAFTQMNVDDVITILKSVL